jgi:glycerol-3-phosphate dehydrogenase
MWTRGWRDDVWSRLGEPFDLVVVGGGITGAGILAEATRLGLRALLLEAQDFSSGTSSRSSKLVHGGLRYLKQAQFRLTIESVRERDLLVREGGGLVSPLGFYLTSFRGDRTAPWVFGLGLFLYDVFARRWDHEKLSAAQVLDKVPAFQGAPLLQAYHYFDAQTDDARLVLRVVREAVRRGALALNYARAEALLREASGRVAGVAVRDLVADRTVEVCSLAVVNATGAWADGLRTQLGATRRLRLIRGSHLVFPRARLPIPEAITLVHPRDNRAVFAIPWEGVTLIGTTDVDHRDAMEVEPAISPEEADYLLALARHAFPSLDLGRGDVLATFAGVRPVIDTGAKNPTKESREHALWDEQGLLTVTGGKLTTFRLMAHQALRALRGTLRCGSPARGPLLDAASMDGDALARLDLSTRARLVGRYGHDAPAVASAGGAERVGESTALWNEVRFAARAEGVVHLEDLLLRRVRLGLLLPHGGAEWLGRIRAAVQAELGWDDARWEAEAESYLATWTRRYSLPV